jgi:hypothetical protein
VHSDLLVFFCTVLQLHNLGRYWWGRSL